MSSIIETIRSRSSVRTYERKEIGESVRKSLMDFILKNQTGPFGNKVRLEFVEASQDDLKSTRELGTYGAIKGAELYLAGAVTVAANAMEDFGYCLEAAILKATELGLGTVWLGGFLNRSAFAKKIGLTKDEVIPAVTPVGYAAGTMSVRDRLIRGVAKSSTRKDFDELFFEGNGSRPMDRKTLGDYEKVLESVRSGPSASNKQPWRIIRETGKKIFHLFLNEDKLYNSAFKNIRIQNLDMGIAMYHFEAAAKELGLQGNWSFQKPSLDAGTLEYIGSWE